MDQVLEGSSKETSARSRSVRRPASRFINGHLAQVNRRLDQWRNRWSINRSVPAHGGFQWRLGGNRGTPSQTTFYIEAVHAWMVARGFCERASRTSSVLVMTRDSTLPYTTHSQQQPRRPVLAHNRHHRQCVIRIATC